MRTHPAHARDMRLCPIHSIHPKSYRTAVGLLSPGENESVFVSMRTIPASRLTPEPMDDEALELLECGAGVAGINKRHRLGGKPEFIEAEEIPVCAFGNPMTFYAQLDSVSEEFSLADCGMIYVFVCFNCFEAKAVLQSR
jgi:hypothetical protein